MKLSNCYISNLNFSSTKRQLFYALLLVLFHISLTACGDKSGQSVSPGKEVVQPAQTESSKGSGKADSAAGQASMTGKPDNDRALTVAKLLEKGGSKLSTAEIISLIVDHSVVFQNLDTGEYFEAIFLNNGRRLLTSIDSGAVEGEAMHDNYRVENDKLHTDFKGTSITTDIYQLGQRYLAAVNTDNGAVKYEIRDIEKAALTVEVLKSQDARVLSNEEIRQLFVGKTLLIKDLLTGDEYTGVYDDNGMRSLQYKASADKPAESVAMQSEDPYRIADDRLYSMLDGNELASTIFEMGSHYYGALNLDEGAVNYEFVPQ